MSISSWRTTGPSAVLRPWQVVPPQEATPRKVPCDLRGRERAFGAQQEHEDQGRRDGKGPDADR
jgi:hypothetical protein